MSQTASERGSLAEVFGAFLRLGLTSFGGPVAHLGYFRAEFVERRKWIDDAEFSCLLALCQFLPGPASSQLGFAIGLQRAGWLGAVAAFVAFTLPSALLLFGLALTASALGGAWWTGSVQGLKLVAVVVVADALWKMGRQLTPDAPRIAIAVASAVIVLWQKSAGAQIIALAAGAVAGLIVLAKPPSAQSREAQQLSPVSRPVIITALGVFALLLVAAVSMSPGEPTLPRLAAAFVRAGALVFGGGHVVLPLLEESVVGPGWISADAFLTGYGAAQAVPGPMFSFAAYLGALTPWSVGSATAVTSTIGALVAVLAIFAPGFLLVVGILPAWNAISGYPQASRIIAGVNAAVVGLLGAALYSPVITSGISRAMHVAVVLIGFALQRHLKRPALWLALWCVTASLMLQAL